MVNAKQDENGKWVVDETNTKTPQITWAVKDGEKNSFEKVVSPTETSYHVSSIDSKDYADGNDVKAIASLTKDSNSVEVTVTYAPNGQEVRNNKSISPKQTVKFVDSEGNELKDPDVQTSDNFVYSGDTYDKETGKKIKDGSWNETSHKFGEVNAPVIKGYVARQKTAGGLTATTEKPEVEAEIIYDKVGNIIPQTPDGKRIPDPKNPGQEVPPEPYTNDPKIPTVVTPNEPVPNIPGYTPRVPSITPDVPTKDTPVI